MLEQVPGLITSHRGLHKWMHQLTHLDQVLGRPSMQVMGVLAVGRVQVTLSTHSKGPARETRTGLGM